MSLRSEFAACCRFLMNHSAWARPVFGFRMRRSKARSASVGRRRRLAGPAGLAVPGRALVGLRARGRCAGSFGRSAAWRLRGLGLVLAVWARRSGRRVRAWNFWRWKFSRCSAGCSRLNARVGLLFVFEFRFLKVSGGQATGGFSS